MNLFLKCILILLISITCFSKDELPTRFAVEEASVVHITQRFESIGYEFTHWAEYIKEILATLGKRSFFKYSPEIKSDSLIWHINDRPFSIQMTDTEETTLSIEEGRSHLVLSRSEPLTDFSQYLKRLFRGADLHPQILTDKAKAERKELNEPPIIYKDAQLEAIQAVEEFLRSGKRNQLIVGPTALGKTIILQHAILKILAQNPKSKILVTTEREELINNLYNGMVKNFPEISSVIKTGSRGNLKKITDHTQVFFTPLDSWIQDYQLIDFYPDYIIFDEAHHAGGEKILSYLNKFIASRQDSFVIGATATPISSNPEFYKFFTNIFYTHQQNHSSEDVLIQQLARAITGGEVMPIGSIRYFSLKNIEGTNIRIRSQKSNRYVLNPEYYNQVLEYLNPLIEKHHNGFINVADQNEAQELCKYLNEQLPDVGFAVYISNTNHKQTLKDYREGKIHWLISVQMLDEGTDLPNLSCYIDLDSTNNARRIIQRIGRLLRLNEKKYSIDWFRLIPYSVKDLQTAIQGAMSGTDKEQRMVVESGEQDLVLNQGTENFREFLQQVMRLEVDMENFLNESQLAEEEKLQILNKNKTRVVKLLSMYQANQDHFITDLKGTQDTLEINYYEELQRYLPSAQLKEILIKAGDIGAQLIRYKPIFYFIKRHILSIHNNTLKTQEPLNHLVACLKEISSSTQPFPERSQLISYFNQNHNSYLLQTYEDVLKEWDAGGIKNIKSYIKLKLKKLKDELKEQELQKDKERITKLLRAYQTHQGRFTPNEPITDNSKEMELYREWQQYLLNDELKAYIQSQGELGNSLISYRPDFDVIKSFILDIEKNTFRLNENLELFLKYLNQVISDTDFENIHERLKIYLSDLNHPEILKIYEELIITIRINGDKTVEQYLLLREEKYKKEQNKVSLIVNTLEKEVDRLCEFFKDHNEFESSHTTILRSREEQMENYLRLQSNLANPIFLRYLNTKGEIADQIKHYKLPIWVLESYITEIVQGNFQIRRDIKSFCSYLEILKINEDEKEFLNQYFKNHSYQIHYQNLIDITDQNTESLNIQLNVSNYIIAQKPMLNQKGIRDTNQKFYERVDELIELFHQNGGRFSSKDQNRQEAKILELKLYREFQNLLKDSFVEAYVFHKGEAASSLKNYKPYFRVLTISIQQIINDEFELDSSYKYLNECLRYFNQHDMPPEEERVIQEDPNPLMNEIYLDLINFYKKNVGFYEKHLRLLNNKIKFYRSLDLFKETGSFRQEMTIAGINDEIERYKTFLDFRNGPLFSIEYVIRLGELGNKLLDYDLYLNLFLEFYSASEKGELDQYEEEISQKYLEELRIHLESLEDMNIFADNVIKKSVFKDRTTITSTLKRILNPNLGDPQLSFPKDSTIDRFVENYIQNGNSLTSVTQSYDEEKKQWNALLWQLKQENFRSYVHFYYGEEVLKSMDTYEMKWLWKVTLDELIPFYKDKKKMPSSLPNKSKSNGKTRNKKEIDLRGKVNNVRSLVNRSVINSDDIKMYLSAKGDLDNTIYHAFMALA
jgi:superfamily II DNA or RNA helicase